MLRIGRRREDSRRRSRPSARRKGAAELWVFVQVKRRGIERRPIPGDVLALPPFDFAMPVRISPITRRRQEERAGRWRCRAVGGPRGAIIFVIAAGHLGAVDPAFQVAWNLEGEVCQPAAIVEIVVVEMDRPVVFRLPGPVILRAVPIPAFHGTGRQVDGRAVVAVTGDVDDAVSGHLLAEIPARDECVRGRPEPRAP